MTKQDIKLLLDISQSANVGTYIKKPGDAYGRRIYKVMTAGKLLLVKTVSHGDWIEVFPEHSIYNN